MSTDLVFAILVPVTLALVSTLRKICPRIDGRLLVLAAATAVGIGLSFAARYSVAGDVLAQWAVVLRGATAAAVAFGMASWPRWAADVLHTALANAAEVSAAPFALGEEQSK